MSPVKARVVIKVKFVRQCNSYGTNIDRKAGLWNLTPKETVYVPGDEFLTLKVPDEARIWHETTRKYCEYEINRFLRVFVRPEGSKTGKVQLS